MRNKTIFLATASFLYSAIAMADNVVLKSKFKLPNNRVSQAPSNLPFSVDVTFGQLTLHMTSANSLCMVVTGPDGVVLTKEITSTGYNIESFDLTPYSNGEYEIHIIDANGNDVSGEFFKGQNESSYSTDEE